MTSPGGCAALIVLTAAIVSAARRGQDTPQPEAGEQILTRACLSCHDSRPVDTQALDEDGWTKSVKTEIAKGAAVKDDEVPVLVDYLVRYHGPLPDGEGKPVVLNICTQCHDLQRVRRTRLNAEGWAEILGNMLNEGAPLTDKDFATVLRYLARNFRPQQ
jgi:cytochrome c5